MLSQHDGGETQRSEVSSAEEPTTDTMVPLEAADPSVSLPTVPTTQSRAPAPPSKPPKPRPQKKERTDAVAAGGKPAKAAKVRDGVEDLALNWLKLNNKPVTTQSMVDALQSKVSKPLVQKALDTLCEQGLIISKDIKKVKVYYLDQLMLQDPLKAPPLESAAKAHSLDDAGPANATEVDANPTSPPSSSPPAALPNKDELITSVLELEAKLRGIVDEHARLMHEPSLTELANAVERAESHLCALQSRLGHVQESLLKHGSKQAMGSHVPDQLDMKSAVDRYYTTRNLWRQRKTMACSVLDCLVGERVWRDVVCDLGLTVDEDCGVSLDSTAVAVPEKYRRK